MNVYQKLQTVRVQLQSMKINKSGHNKFAGYYYMELGDFLMPIQTLFFEHGLCGAISFTSEIATLTIIDSDDPAQTIVFTSPMSSAALKGCHDVQNVGAVETYQRRYLWLAAMEIVEHDALDAMNNDEKKSAGKNKKEDNKEEQRDPDAEILAQFNAAQDMQSLTKLMNGLSQNEKKIYTSQFNKRMKEIKEGA